MSKSIDNQLVYGNINTNSDECHETTQHIQQSVNNHKKVNKTNLTQNANIIKDIAFDEDSDNETLLTSVDSLVQDLYSSDEESVDSIGNENIFNDNSNEMLDQMLDYDEVSDQDFEEELQSHKQSDCLSDTFDESLDESDNIPETRADLNNQLYGNRVNTNSDSIDEQNSDNSETHSLKTRLRSSGKVMKVNIIRGGYRCTFRRCGKAFDSDLSLQTHIFWHLEAEDKLFFCYINDCNKLFRTKSSLDCHQKRAHPQQDNTTHMTDSQKTTNLKNKSEFHSICFDFEENLNKLRDNSQDIYAFNSDKERICDNLCDEWNAFRSKFKLKSHARSGISGMNSHHQDQKLLKRPKNRAKSILTDKTKANTPGINSGYDFACKWKDCSAVFKEMSHLKEHLNEHSPLYLCPHDGCNFKGYSQLSLKYHIRKHSVNKRFKCLINGCKKEFRINDYLHRHQVIAHPQQFPHIPWIECIADDCGFKTKSKYNYSYHMKKHNPPHGCAHCLQVFARKDQLRSHLKSH